MGIFFHLKSLLLDLRHNVSSQKAYEVLNINSFVGELSVVLGVGVGVCFQKPKIKTTCTS